MSCNNGNFSDDVKVFFKLDDELKGVSKGIKDIRSNKTTIEERIANHMEQNDLPETISTSGKIKIYKSKSTTPINKPMIHESAVELFGAEKADSLMKHIESKRETTEKVRIKRVNQSSDNKSKKSKTSE